MRERLPDYNVLVESGRILTLAGAPGRIRHELEFQNDGDQRAILRMAAVKCEEIEAVTGRRPGVLMPTVVLHPGQSRRVPIHITIPYQTPPGRYEGELLVAGMAMPLVIHVAEEYCLDVTPGEVVLENKAGGRSIKQVVCTNSGNVPLMIGEIGAVVLDDELTTCRSLRAVTAAWPDEDGDDHAVDRFIDLYVKEGWKRVVAHSGVLRVHTVGGPRELAPGSTEVVDLEVTLPDRLEPRTRYTGVAPLYTTDLTFRIVPARGRPRAGDDEDEGREKAARGRKRAPAAKSARIRKSAS